MVILDLEDGVSKSRKPHARQSLIEHPIDPERTIVRINPTGTEECARDLEVLKVTPYETVMVPKVDAADDIRALAPRRVVALCETARGVLAAREIALEPNVVALMWGSEDLLASVGGFSSRHSDGSYRDIARYARAAVLLAARAGGVAAIDSVFLDIEDLDGLAAESTDAAASGFHSKACIHPVQVPVVRRTFLPTGKDVGWAERLLAAASARRGAFRFEGRMVDEPLLAQARQILSASRRYGGPAPQSADDTG